VLKFVLRKIIRLLKDNSSLLIEDREKELLIKANLDLTKYKPINFYAANPEILLKDKLNLLQNYINELTRLADRLKKLPAQNNAVDAFISEISKTLVLLENKQKQLVQIQTKIPEGMLDVKRALYLAKSSAALSKSDTEETRLKKNLVVLKHFMSGLNDQYNEVIKQGGSLDSLLLKGADFYWGKLANLTKLVKQTLHCLENCSQLTPAGQLTLRCLKSVLLQIPSKKTINEALDLLKKAKEGTSTTQTVIQKIGFYAPSSRDACLHLIKSGKQFFHMPHNDSMYHFDYDPTNDIADTLGNCFGESMLFIQALTMGTFKRICPESALINFQLDQSLTLKCQKQSLGQAETEVSAKSTHQSIQWEDLEKLLLTNSKFNSGDLCGIVFKMNGYTRSQQDVSSGHITVVAKLDTKLSPFKYIVSDKTIGTFGLVDDDSLAYVITELLLPMYEGANYSRAQLFKYGEATKATYTLLKGIKPISDNSEPKVVFYKKEVEKPYQTQFFASEPTENKGAEVKEQGIYTHPLSLC
jgi:hypothetical protein